MKIDEVPLPGPGRLYATGFTVVGADPAAAMSHVEADLLLCLLQPDEIDRRFPDFARWLGAAAGAALHFPVDDGGIGHEDQVLTLIERLGAHLDAGGSVLTHCGAGLGRTSIVCALLLVRAGSNLHDALEAVRAARPGAGPENPVQRAHLERLAARVRARA
jgi:Cyclin-dependent kinase inhibitor 3 (CDKN3)